MDKKNEDEKIEMLDFEDDEVSRKIDEMLDFVDVSDDTLLEELLSKQDDEKKIKIDASSEKLNEYTPSIKDFNIKSAKTRKIVKKSMLYVIILMLLGFEFFINKTGNILNDLRVYASDNMPIKIVQNEKYGYIDYTGNKIVSPKYTYAEDFIKGYAIVKNASNLPLIIDRAGKEVIKSSTYFSIYRAKEDIIASKITKKGLKYGILDSNLKTKTSFKYDLISYLGDCFSFVDDNSVGLLNLSGKKIFEYKLTGKEDKKLILNVPTYTSSDFQKYGVVTVNNTSQIVNLEDGKMAYAPTLNEITPEENNVFYETSNEGVKRYIYVQDNKTLLELESYGSLSITSPKAGVLKAMTSNYNYEFISTKTLEQIKKGLLIEEVFEGDGLFMYNEHNYKKNINSVVLIKNGEKIKSINQNFTVYEGFKNGAAIVKLNDGAYAYINEDGNLINDKLYEEAQSFDSYGNAVCKLNGKYGVIDKNGNLIVDYIYDSIKSASPLVKKKSSVDSNNIFFAGLSNDKYVLLNKNGKKVNKTYYNDVLFDEEYPIIKVSTDTQDLIIFSKELKSVALTSFNSKYQAFDNYIIVKNEYYNYKGKLIYVDKTKKENYNE